MPSSNTYSQLNFFHLSRLLTVIFLLIFVTNTNAAESCQDLFDSFGATAPVSKSLIELFGKARVSQEINLSVEAVTQALVDELRERKTYWWGQQDPYQYEGVRSFAEELTTQFAGMNKLDIKIIYRSGPRPVTLVILGENHWMLEDPKKNGHEILSRYQTRLLEMSPNQLETRARVLKRLGVDGYYNKERQREPTEGLAEKVLMRLGKHIYSSTMNDAIIISSNAKENESRAKGKNYAIDKKRLLADVVDGLYLIYRFFNKKISNQSADVTPEQQIENYIFERRHGMNIRNLGMAKQIIKIADQSPTNTEMVLILGQAHVDPIIELLVKNGWEPRIF